MDGTGVHHQRAGGTDSQGGGSGSHAPAAPVTGGSRGSLIAEALGYLGGVLIVVAASLITFQYWSDIPTAGRLALPASAAALLLAAGWVVEDSAPS